MVKIRYAELPAGLHVTTEAGDRCTIVYLKPGLTQAQRREALTVARRTARLGHGPSLPALDMTFALAADRTRTTARIMASAMRNHPLLMLPLLALVLGIIAAGILASVAPVIPVPPRVSSAQSGDLSRFNVGPPENRGTTLSPPSTGGTHSSGTRPPAAGGGPGQGASHGGARHGRGRPAARPAAAAGIPGPAPAR